MHTHTHAHHQHSGRRPARGRIRDGRTTLLFVTAAAAAAATTTVIGSQGMAAAAAAAFLPPFQQHRTYSGSHPLSLGRQRSNSGGGKRGGGAKPNSLAGRRQGPPTAVDAATSGWDGDGGSSRISRALKGGAVAPLPGQAHAVVFVRHGQSDFNRFELFTGWCDVDINDVVRWMWGIWWVSYVGVASDGLT